MSNDTVLVLGASGFLGGHVAQQLVAAGRKVRALIRETSDQRGLQGLDLEIVYGDILDPDSIRKAMQGCDTLYHCIVDTRAWIRDTRPLYRVNVDGLQTTLDIALEFPLKRFIFTSTYATIGRNTSGIATEADEFNWWDKAPEYIRTRVLAERMVLSYCKDKGLPGIVCCIGDTYGSGDFQPTPHGKLVADAARSKMPFFWPSKSASVGIDDAARGMLLAEEKGRVGERYIISGPAISKKELFTMAARRSGVKPPALNIPIPIMYVLGTIGDFFGFLLQQDNKLSIASVRCSYYMNDMDASKAKQELGWEPAPIEESVNAAVDFYEERRLEREQVR